MEESAVVYDQPCFPLSPSPLLEVRWLAALCTALCWGQLAAQGLAGEGLAGTRGSPCQHQHIVVPAAASCPQQQRVQVLPQISLCLFGGTSLQHLVPLYGSVPAVDGHFLLWAAEWALGSTEKVGGQLSKGPKCVRLYLRPTVAPKASSKHSYTVIEGFTERCWQRPFCINTIRNSGMGVRFLFYANQCS